MPTNTQIVATLGWTDAPPDLSCIPGDINQLGPILAQFLTVNSNTSEIDTSAQDSIAQQALEQSAIALATAQSALAAQASLRSSGAPLALQTGDSQLAISWSPAFVDTNYMIIGTYYGTAASIGAYYAFRVLEGSRTTTGCTIIFENTPAGFKFSYLVRSLT